MADSYIYLNREVQCGSPMLYCINRSGLQSRVGPDFDIARSSSYPYCVIHYIVEGEGRVEFRGKTYPVESGQLFVLGAHEAHRYMTDPQKLLTLNWIEFSGGDSINLVRALLDVVPPVFSGKQSLSANRYIERICTALNSNYRSKHILISKMIYSVILKLAEENILMQSAEKEYYPIGIKLAADYIEKNLGGEISIDILAKISNYSPTYFARLFHKTTGITPARYIEEQRLVKAKELLNKGDVQVDAVSEELGFCNTSHFIRVFKKAEGMTPAEFRNQSMMYRKGVFNP